MTLHFPTRAERPGRLPHAASLRERVWPEFMYHDPVLERLFGRVIGEDAEFHFYAWDDEREEVVGVGNAVPASWDGACPTEESTPSSKRGSRREPRSRPCSARCRS
jgi:hypothetical protein